jgi:hypothetical protein
MPDTKPEPRHAALLVAGETEEERRLNLGYALRTRYHVDTNNPEVYDPLVHLQCGTCDDSRSYKTLEEIPMETLICKCGKCYLIYAVSSIPEVRAMLDGEPAVTAESVAGMRGLTAISGSDREEND